VGRVIVDGGIVDGGIVDGGGVHGGGGEGSVSARVGALPLMVVLMIGAINPRCRLRHYHRYRLHPELHRGLPRWLPPRHLTRRKGRPVGRLVGLLVTVCVILSRPRVGAGRA